MYPVIFAPPTTLFPNLVDAEVMASVTDMVFGPPDDLPAAREQAVHRQAVASEFRNIYQYGTFIKDAEIISEQVSRRPQSPELGSGGAGAAQSDTPPPREIPFSPGARETKSSDDDEGEGNW